MIHGIINVSFDAGCYITKFFYCPVEFLFHFFVTVVMVLNYILVVGLVAFYSVGLKF